MFRVSENFKVVNPKTLEEPIEGLSVGEAKRNSPISVIRGYTLTIDYGTKENYEKNFTVLNDKMTEVLGKLGVTVAYDKLDIKVVLLDEPKEPKPITSEEPMTWQKWHKWHEERLKNLKK